MVSSRKLHPDFDYFDDEIGHTVFIKISLNVVK